MGYISKQLLKKAYNTLSGLTEDHKQGQTQIVSALRYIVALDMFYKEKERNCNLGSSIDRDDFTSNVRFVVNVCDDYYTANFYTTIEEMADCRVGSNFFSQGVVAKSKTNTEITLDYPTRGSFPLFKVKNNNLFYEDGYLANISNYLPTDLLKTAFVIWLLRNEHIDELSLEEVQETLLTILNSKLIQQIIPKEEVFQHYVDGFLLDDEKTSLSPADFLQMFETKTNKQPQTNNTSNTLKKEIMFKYPLQQIFYGAPGTGKSHEIKRLTKGEKVIRTTFHPDSDYSTFVGAYKPTMEVNDVHVVPVVVNNGISLQSKGTYKEKRIVYRFVMQAFLKAYLSAWKKYTDVGTSANPSAPSTLHFNASGAHYTITGIDANGITYNKNFQYPLTVNKIATTWNEIWSSGSFVMPSGRIPGRSIEQAISQWIKDHLKNCTKDSLEEGLDAFKEEIVNTWVVVVSRGTQKYSFYANGDNEFYTVSADSTSTRNTLKEYFTGEKDIEDATEIKRKLVDKLAEFDADSFDNAWDKMTAAVNGTQVAPINIDITPDPQFLIIEEINRGNCAQIFGDLFQLLDRGDNGFSEYPIEADNDLQKEIKKAFEESKDFKLENDIDVDDVVEDYTSNYDATLSEDIQNGRILLLPPNLYIWATMNTSDQSLFPIDSAFKRRWDWKYMKIAKGKDKDDNDLDWKIVVKDKEGYAVKINNEESLPWWDFIRKINDIISSMTSSADKQLGYFFCKAKNGIIDEETFVSKVIFYLWNDVFKDYGFEDASLFQYKDDKGEPQDLTFPDFYDEEGKQVNTVRLKDFIENVMNWKKEKEEQK